MAKTTLDDLLTHDINGEVKTLPEIEKKRKEYPRSAGPGSPAQETVSLYGDISNIFKSTTELNLGQRNPDFIHGDSFQVYYSHPNYKNNPYISSYPPIKKSIDNILWACDMRNQQSSSFDAPLERNARLNNYNNIIRIEVIKLYKDKTVTVPKKRKSAIFLLEGDVWVITSKHSNVEQMLYVSDIRHGEQGLWLKALREREMFPRRLLGENTGVLTGNVLKTTIIPEKDSSIVVVDYA
jgi:hypothetical protein